MGPVVAAAPIIHLRIRNAPSLTTACGTPTTPGYTVGHTWSESVTCDECRKTEAYKAMEVADTLGDRLADCSICGDPTDLRTNDGTPVCEYCGNKRGLW